MKEKRKKKFRLFMEVECSLPLELLNMGVVSLCAGGCRGRPMGGHGNFR